MKSMNEKKNNNVIDLQERRLKEGKDSLEKLIDERLDQEKDLREEAIKRLVRKAEKLKWI